MYNMANSEGLIQHFTIFFFVIFFMNSARLSTAFKLNNFPKCNAVSESSLFMNVKYSIYLLIGDFVKIKKKYGLLLTHCRIDLTNSTFFFNASVPLNVRPLAYTIKAKRYMGSFGILIFVLSYRNVELCVHVDYNVFNIH